MAIIIDKNSKISLSKQIIANDNGKLKIDNIKFKKAIEICGGFNFNSDLIYVKIKPKVITIYAYDTDSELISVHDTDSGISIKYGPVNSVIIKTIDDMDVILEKINSMKQRNKFKSIENYLNKYE